MLIKHRDSFRRQFYDVIRKEHVLLVVGDDVDALCSAMILTKLFACDDVSFSLVTVGGWDALEKTIEEHYEQNPAIVLINCGANRSIDEIQLPEQSKIFILDSRRPVNHLNVYNNGQVAVLLDEDEESSSGIPSAESVIPTDSDDESSDDEDDDSGNRLNAMDRIQKKTLKREVRRKWEQRRRDILWKYYEATWHSSASSVFMLELAQSLNRATSELMWLAAVGLNSQWTDRLISTEAYIAICYERMRPFMHKFTPKENLRADDVLRISFQPELPLAMYNQWSLYRAMTVDEHFACRTRNWTQKGDTEMKHLLAQLGLTLDDTRQMYEAMDVERRKEVFAILEKDMNSSFASFSAHLGYSKIFTAATVARALAVKLETPYNSPLADRNTIAREVIRPFLEPGADPMDLLKGCESYKIGMEAVWTIVSSAVNQSQVVAVDQFFHFAASQELDDDLLQSRHFLSHFSHFLLRAFAVSGRNRGRKPLIVGFPLSGIQKGWHLVTGVMPLDAVYENNLQKCFIGRAFRQVSKRKGMEESISMDNFESNIIRLRSTDRARFITILQDVMAK